MKLRFFSEWRAGMSDIRWFLLDAGTASRTGSHR